MKTALKIVLLLTLSVLPEVRNLENGLLRTPPMGWMSWTVFYCQTDCQRHPLTCISENTYMEMADIMAVEGYAEAGYKYVHIDDCWLKRSRDSQGKLVADKTRFPHGILWLSNYMHSRGLKLGLYEDYGTKTCEGYPGSKGSLKVDSDTFAEWKVDYLKLDGCNNEGPADMDAGYPAMSQYLNASAYPIAYSCSWPAYLTQGPIKPNYTKIAHYCNLWRNFDDISRSWKSVQSIIDFYDKHQDELAAIAGPGKWNDPDMIIVGNPELTIDQSKVQLAIWSIWSAPLIMSNDLRFVAPPYKEILLNKKVIAIDQDPLGIMGKLVVNTTTGIGIYLKPVTPTREDDYSFALVVFNRNLTLAANVTFVMARVGLTSTSGYFVEDLFTNAKHGLMLPNDVFFTTVPPTGVTMIKATLAAATRNEQVIT